MDDGLSHEVFLFDGEEEFLAGMVPYAREGLAAGERVVAALSEERGARLAAALGTDARQVEFVDIEQAGRNPARIISMWGDRLEGPGHEPRALRGICEPVWAGRSSDEFAECHRHEALINLAFAEAGSWRLVCPYDVSALEPEQVELARRTHPEVWEQGSAVANSSYEQPAELLAELEQELPTPDGEPTRLTFGRSDVSSIRRLAASYATSAGLGDERAADVMLAISELATNSVVHGGGEGEIALWKEPGSLVCEVSDSGTITDILAGRRRPDPAGENGRGIWIVNQVCDLVQVRSAPGGSVVRVQLRAA
ncbi:MAG: sensor histidine kinase [Thermoleophilaceae bacterium]|nr:sensor histidine kinase [Thermoleophilaceae bacterium]